jgi:hypothetical protein
MLAIITFSANVRKAGRRPCAEKTFHEPPAAAERFSCRFEAILLAFAAQNRYALLR